MLGILFKFIEENHRHYVKKTGNKTTWSKFGDTVFTGMVFYSYFPDFVAIPMGLHRNKPVQLSVNLNFLHNIFQSYLYKQFVYESFLYGRLHYL